MSNAFKREYEVRIYLNGCLWDTYYASSLNEANEWQEQLEDTGASIWDRINCDALEQFIEEFHIEDAESIVVTAKTDSPEAQAHLTYEDFLDIIKAQDYIKTRFDVVTHFTGYNGTFTTYLWEFTVMAFEDGYLTA